MNETSSSSITQATDAAPARRQAAGPNSYDLLPGEPRPLQATQPDVLAVTAALAGVAAVPVGGCRVLEIGCGVGGNLLPMAQALPQSTFVGIDLSHKQIAAAQRTAAGAGLSNVRLEARHFAALPADFGPFDYIIAHGVYFRTPASSRDRLLDAIAGLLSPD